MITENTFPTIKTARYFTLGSLSTEIENVWIVLHGYGQLASEFLSNFKSLKNENTIIIAPEGLNKFYFRGFSGKVGASWMTKEARDSEITDYVNFLTDVYKRVIDEVIFSKVKINVLGFSQGTHTAVRWLDRTRFKIDNLILCSGSLPNDCNYKDGSHYWTNLNMKFYLGENDRIIDKTMITKQIEEFKNINQKIEFYTHNSGHELDSIQLLEISNNL